MRCFRFGTLILAAALLTSPAWGQEPQPAPASPTPASAVAASAPENQVDPLFEALRRERDPEKARGIASQIAAEMNDSQSPTVNLLMQWAATAMEEKRNAAALDFLDQATILEPAYTEAFNRRATLHYAMGNQRKSMSDINEVLKREPRHFGAIAGMAAILAEDGQDELSLKAWERYLSIYPADRDAQEAVTKMSEKLAGSRT
jgi:tetratricopeptide (TPR) repeat protein